MNEVSQQHKTCTVTVVEPGLPDKVIRIRPALHETEKVWLDKRPGIERWAAIEQLLRQYCPRGRYVPSPAYWHQPGAHGPDANVLILRPEDIPVAELDGAVFEPLPEEKRATRPKPEDKAQATNDRVKELEQRIDRLTAALFTNTAESNPAVATEEAKQPARRGPGRPRKTQE